VTKNKVAPPFREAEFDIMFNEGISKVGDILDIATTLNLIDKRGAFFRYHDEMIGQGRENAKQFLRENPAMAMEIENLIRAEYGLSALTPADEGVIKRCGHACLLLPLMRIAIAIPAFIAPVRRADIRQWAKPAIISFGLGHDRGVRVGL
jgi:hypothetical protein